MGMNVGESICPSKLST